MSTPFSIELKVRDYECDYQGIVNHTCYLNYIEHARHEYCSSKNVNFTLLSSQGYDLVVTHLEADFFKSLVSGDMYRVVSTYTKVGRIRGQFIQHIERLSDQAMCFKAIVTITCVHNKKPCWLPELDEKLLD